MDKPVVLTAFHGEANPERMQVFGLHPFTILIAGVDIWIVWGWVAGTLDTSAALGWHLVALLGLGAAMLLIRRKEPAHGAASLLICLLLGPIGGFFLLFCELGRTTAAARALPPDLGIPETRADRIHSQIEQGRRRPSHGQIPSSFANMFESGSLADRQQAIAAISMGYRAEMLPALRRALASDSPAIRVQAAAVFAKLRGQFGDRAKAVLADAPNGPLSAAFASEARTVAHSGFVDRETAQKLLAHAARAHRTTPGQRPDRPRRAGATTRPPRLKRYSCGGLA